MTKTVTHYEVTVWNNFTGDVVKYLRDASEEDLAALEDYFDGEPGYQVVIDNEWDEEEADE